jgi:hypothetical protein
MARDAWLDKQRPLAPVQVAGVGMELSQCQREEEEGKGGRGGEDVVAMALR